MRNKLFNFVLILLLFPSCDFGYSKSSGDNSFNSSVDNSSNPSTVNNNNETIIEGTSGAGQCELLKFPDGDLKNLWKPESDKNGAVAILFNNDFTDIFSSVCLTVASTSEREESEECCVFSGFTNPDRQTWRCQLPGGEYTGEMLVTLSSGALCPVTIATPGQRVD